MSLIELRLQPTGPWRAGHPAGERDRVDVVYHSDALFSAVTHAMKSLGHLEEWLESTANAGLSQGAMPAVRFSSLFPFAAGLRLIPPPRTAWPPSGSGKLYSEGAKYVPIEVARKGIISESHWMVDGASACLLPAGAEPPFEVSIRSAAAVDRVTGNTEPHRTAGIEFAEGAGYWGLIDVTEAWEQRIKSALRLLADSGFGGERSNGWGRAADPQFTDASTLFNGPTHEGAWWLLSLYSPHEADAVDWSRGDYSAVVRGGWTDSPTGGAVRKKRVRMIEEGSVVIAPALRGRAVDVAPEGFPHPTWRSGVALAVALPAEVEL